MRQEEWCACVCICMLRALRKQENLQNQENRQNIAIALRRVGVKKVEDTTYSVTEFINGPYGEGINLENFDQRIILRHF